MGFRVEFPTLAFPKDKILGFVNSGRKPSPEIIEQRQRFNVFFQEVLSENIQTISLDCVVGKPWPSCKDSSKPRSSRPRRGREHLIEQPANACRRRWIVYDFLEELLDLIVTGLAIEGY
jgi:hypothetical protein